MSREAWALISVYDKTGVVELANTLVQAGYSILSTGGTAKVLAAAGVPIQKISDYTDSPEILDGRVKTLHPKIYGGLLARRDDSSHRAQVEELGIGWIDCVVVNLYPFVETIANEGVTTAEAIEQIDIGGPTMLRAAAKNHESVTVVCDPGDYAEVAQSIAKGGTDVALRRRLAAKVYAHTSDYDSAIAGYLTDGGHYALSGLRTRELRYGENPHQKAAFYATTGSGPGTVAGAEFLGSNKELSYNNILDLDAALALVREYRDADAACAIIKHNNPCGAAIGADLGSAYAAALACDPMSAFGSIVACSVEVDEAAARKMSAPGNFIEALIAPRVAAGAMEILRGAKFGKNLRVMQVGTLDRPATPQLRAVSGGFLIQDEDAPARPLELDVVTKRAPTEAELACLRFAWPVVKHVRSNAIVIANANATVGIGAGQMSRVDSVEIAVRKSGDKVKGAVLASDAFFPFPDGLLAAADAGVTACIQPGGSRQDPAVIEAADERGVAMVFTGTRHFKH